MTMKPLQSQCEPLCQINGVRLFKIKDLSFEECLPATGLFIQKVNDPNQLTAFVLKFRKGDEILDLSIPVSQATEFATLRSNMLVLTFAEKSVDSIAVQFERDEDFRVFKETIGNIKSGKIQSIFEKRTEETSAVQYFQFYSFLSQQQNMLQDYVRTATYQRAIQMNDVDFRDKVVLDVGGKFGSKAR